MIVEANFLQEFVNEVRSFGSRPHYTHVPLEDIDKLGQLVQTCFAQQLSK